MLASAPLIVLVCFLLSYLKGLSLLLLICAATTLYCIRRHTFKPAIKPANVKAKNPAQQTIDIAPLMAAVAPVPAPSPEQQDEDAKKVFWQASSEKQSNVYTFPKTSTYTAAK